MSALAACRRVMLSPAHWHPGPPGEETGEGKTWPLLPHRRVTSLSLTMSHAHFTDGCFVGVILGAGGRS